MPQKTPSKSRRESGTVANLATQLGYTSRHAGTLMKKGMPDTITEARAWLSERENSDTAVELRRRRIALLREQERLAKTKADEADGLLMTRAECEQSWIELCTAIGAALNRMEREIPSACLGLGLSESYQKTREIMREIRTKLSEGHEDYWSKHPAKNATK